MFVKHSSPPKRSYLARAIGLQLHVASGQVVEVFVAHDSDCPRLQGGECSCSPDMTAAMPNGERVVIEADGVAVPRGLPS